MIAPFDSNGSTSGSHVPSLDHPRFRLDSAYLMALLKRGAMLARRMKKTTDLPLCSSYLSEFPLKVFSFPFCTWLLLWW